MDEEDDNPIKVARVESVEESMVVNDSVDMSPRNSQLSPTTRWALFNNQWQTQPSHPTDIKTMDLQLQSLLAIAKDEPKVESKTVKVVTMNEDNPRQPKYEEHAPGSPTDSAVSAFMFEMGL